jgi:hypothetical protein
MKRLEATLSDPIAGAIFRVVQTMAEDTIRELIAADPELRALIRAVAERRLRGLLHELSFEAGLSFEAER